LHLNQVRIHL